MCSFNCFVGESLRIEDLVCLHIREAERGQVSIMIEQLGQEQRIVEVISLQDEEDFAAPDIVN